MKGAVFSAALLSAVGANMAYSAPSQPTLDCGVGPVPKKYGTADWLVYSCSDKKSLVFITPGGSAAAPFYFMMTPENGKYRIVGEGTGNKRITDAAYQELAKLSDSSRAALIKETLAVKGSK